MCIPSLAPPLPLPPSVLSSLSPQELRARLPPDNLQDVNRTSVRGSGETGAEHVGQPGEKGERAGVPVPLQRRNQGRP